MTNPKQPKEKCQACKDIDCGEFKERGKWCPCGCHGESPQPKQQIPEDVYEVCNEFISLEISKARQEVIREVEKTIKSIKVVDNFENKPEMTRVLQDIIDIKVKKPLLKQLQSLITKDK